MSFTASELLNQFRLRMDDIEIPYLWSNEEVLDAFDQAQAEFCHEVDVITDQITLSYNIGDDFIDQPDYVTRIRRALINSDGKTIRLFNEEEWQDGAYCYDDYGIQTSAPPSNWETTEAEKPTAIITDLEAGKIRLYPIPTVADALKLRVYRKPIRYMLDGYEPEVTDRDMQRALILGARAWAYLKHDSETYDAEMHETMLGHFNKEIERFSTIVKRRTRRAGQVKYGGIPLSG